MYTCPHCQKRAMTWLRKGFLGPLLRATCRECGKKVSVPWYAVLVSIPLIAALITADQVGSLPVKLVIGVVGILLGAIIHSKWIPLIRR